MMNITYHYVYFEYGTGHAGALIFTVNLYSPKKFADQMIRNRAILETLSCTYVCMYGDRGQR